jgi:hypothetical protein
MSNGNFGDGKEVEAPERGIPEGKGGLGRNSWDEILGREHTHPPRSTKELFAVFVTPALEKKLPPIPAFPSRRNG